jgi:hypothetical protein
VKFRITGEAIGSCRFAGEILSGDEQAQVDLARFEVEFTDESFTG